MGQLTRDCPHCHTKSVSLTSFASVLKEGTRNYVTAFYCNNCFGGYIAEIECKISTIPHARASNIDSVKEYRIISECPKAISISSPQYTPENIDKFYLQAANALKSGSYDASAMMSRKVLEVAVKKLNPSGTGKLYNRIEELSNNGTITEELKDWAHIIRDDGNEAAHEEEPVSAEFSKELLSFAEMFLMYTFTMPGMVAAKRKNAADAGE